MTREPRSSLGERLAAVEQPGATGREAYARELQALLRRRLGLGVRLFLGVVGAYLLVLGYACFQIAFLRPAGSEVALVRALVGIVAAGLLSVGAGVLVITVWGVYRREREGRWLGLLALGTIALIGFFLIVGPIELPDPADRALMERLGDVFLGIAAVLTLALLMARHHVRTQEKLLELEYRLAEMAEKLTLLIEGRQGGSNPPG